MTETNGWTLVGHKSNRKGDRPILYWVETRGKALPKYEEVKVRQPVSMAAPGPDRPILRLPERSTPSGTFPASALRRLYEPVMEERALALLREAQ